MKREDAGYQNKRDRKLLFEPERGSSREPTTFRTGGHLIPGLPQLLLKMQQPRLSQSVPVGYSNMKGGKGLLTGKRNPYQSPFFHQDISKPLGHLLLATLVLRRHATCEMYRQCPNLFRFS